MEGIEGILYGLGKKRMLSGNTAFIKINTEAIESRKAGMFQEVLHLPWEQVKSLNI